MDSSNEKIIEIFNICDKNQNGYITENELITICPDLTPKEVHQVFLELDKDNNGIVTLKEFIQGFLAIDRNIRINSKEFLDNLKEKFGNLTCLNDIYELYESMNSDKNQTGVVLFESILNCLAQTFIQIKLERDQAIDIQLMERKQFSEQLKNLPNELMKMSTSASNTLHNRNDNQLTEVIDLRARLNRLEKMEQEVYIDRQMGITRENCESYKNEICRLKNALNNANAQLSFIKSDHDRLKIKFEDKCYESENEKELLLQYMNEHENLTRQIHSLHDANTRLQSFNDDMRTISERQKNRKSFSRDLSDFQKQRNSKQSEDVSLLIETDQDTSLMSTSSISVQPQIPKIPLTYRVVLAGDSNVGKSSFLTRLCHGIFQPVTKSTIVDFQTTIVQVESTQIAVQIWDTAGQERFRSMAKSYFRKADGVLLLYDSSDVQTFLNVRDWVGVIDQVNRTPIVLCANKSDIEFNEAVNSKNSFVSAADGQRLADEINAGFLETSAKNGKNVKLAVLQLSKLIYENEQNFLSHSLKNNESVKLTKRGHNRKKRLCCNN